MIKVFYQMVFSWMATYFDWTGWRLPRLDIDALDKVVELNDGGL
jgi:hypothetical protein